MKRCVTNYRWKIKFCPCLLLHSLLELALYPIPANDIFFSIPVNGAKEKLTILKLKSAKQVSALCMWWDDGVCRAQAGMVAWGQWEMTVRTLVREIFVLKLASQPPREQTVAFTHNSNVSVPSSEGACSEQRQNTRSTAQYRWIIRGHSVLVKSPQGHPTNKTTSSASRVTWALIKRNRAPGNPPSPLPRNPEKTHVLRGSVHSLVLLWWKLQEVAPPERS